MKLTESNLQQSTEILTPDESGRVLNPPDNTAKIAERAYYKAERRGFEPGHELEDWLEAEQELAPTEDASSVEYTSART